MLDEATASVDFATDDALQATIRSIESVTTLTIAHRISTIMHCDRVIVMHQGQLAEAGPPAELRERPGSRFGELCDAASTSNQMTPSPSHQQLAAINAAED